MNETFTYISTGLFVLSTLFLFISFRRPKRTAPKSLIFSAAMAAFQALLYLAVTHLKVAESFLLFTFGIGMIAGLIGAGTTRLVPHGGIIWSRNSGWFLLFWGTMTAMNQIRSSLNAEQGSLALGLTLLSTGSVIAVNLSTWFRYHILRRRLKNTLPPCSGCGTPRQPGSHFCSRCGPATAVFLIGMFGIGWISFRQDLTVLGPREMPNHWKYSSGTVAREYQFQKTLKGIKVHAAIEAASYILREPEKGSKNPRTPTFDPNKKRYGYPEGFKDPRLVQLCKHGLPIVGCAICSREGGGIKPPPQTPPQPAPQPPATPPSVQPETGESVTLFVCVALNVSMAKDITLDVQGLVDDTGGTWQSTMRENKRLGDYCLETGYREVNSGVPILYKQYVVARTGSCVVLVEHILGAAHGTPGDFAFETAQSLVSRLVRGEWEKMANAAGIPTEGGGAGPGETLVGSTWLNLVNEQPPDQPIMPEDVAIGSASVAVWSLLHLVGWLIMNRGMSAPDAVRLAMKLMKGNIPDHLQPLIKSGSLKKDLLDYGRSVEAAKKVPVSTPAPSPEPSPPAEAAQLAMQAKMDQLQADIEYHKREMEYYQDKLASGDPRQAKFYQMMIRQNESLMAAYRDNLRAVTTGQYQRTRTSYDSYISGIAHDKSRELFASYAGNVKAIKDQFNAFKQARAILDKMPPGSQLPLERTLQDALLQNGLDPDQRAERYRRISSAALKSWHAQRDAADAKDELLTAQKQFSKEVVNSAFGVASMIVPGGVLLDVAGGAMIGALDGGGWTGAATGAATNAAFNAVASGLSRGVRAFKGAATETGTATGSFLPASKSGGKGVLPRSSSVPKVPRGPSGTKAATGSGTALSKPKPRPAEPPPPKPPSVDNEKWNKLKQMENEIAQERKLARKHLDELADLRKQHIMAQRTRQPAGDIERKIEKKVAEINGLYHGKSMLKHEAPPSLGRFHDKHTQALNGKVDRKFEELMAKKGWSPQQTKNFRNAASRGKVSMDRDKGLVEPNLGDTMEAGGKPVPKYTGPNDPQYWKDRIAFNKHLTQDGQRKSLHEFQKAGQEGLEQAYLDTTGQNPKHAFQKFTSGADAEIYRDMAVLKGDPKNTPFSQKWSQQTADVTRFKAHELRNHPEHAGLSQGSALMEEMRGTAKDSMSKLLPMLKGNPHVPPQQFEQVSRVTRVLHEVGTGKMSLTQGESMLRGLTGGRVGLDNATEMIANHLQEGIRVFGK